jgi:hypothetical protein
MPSIITFLLTTNATAWKLVGLVLIQVVFVTIERP